MKLKILVGAGDGIGPEVTREALRILVSVAEFGGYDFQFSEMPIGGHAIRQTGTPLPATTLDAALESDAGEYASACFVSIVLHDGISGRLVVRAENAKVQVAGPNRGRQGSGVGQAGEKGNEVGGVARCIRHFDLVISNDIENERRSKGRGCTAVGDGDHAEQGPQRILSVVHVGEGNSGGARQAAEVALGQIPCGQAVVAFDGAAVTVTAGGAE